MDQDTPRAVHQGDASLTVVGPRLDELGFDEWISWGITRGWISDIVCNTHDGLPSSGPEEEEQWDDGYDPCVPACRIWGEDGPPSPAERGNPPRWA